MADGPGKMMNDDEFNHGWLVVEPTPLKNMSSSVGIMKFPISGKS